MEGGRTGAASGGGAGARPKGRERAAAAGGGAVPPATPQAAGRATAAPAGRTRKRAAGSAPPRERPGARARTDGWVENEVAMGDLAGAAPRTSPRGGPTGADAAGRGPLGVRLRPRAARRVQLAGAPAGTTALVNGGLPAARLAVPPPHPGRALRITYLPRANGLGGRLRPATLGAQLHRPPQRTALVPHTDRALRRRGHRR